MVTYKSKLFIVLFSMILVAASLGSLYQAFLGPLGPIVRMAMFGFFSLYTVSFVLVLIKHKFVPAFLRICAAIWTAGSLLGTVEFLRTQSPIGAVVVMIVLCAMSILAFVLVSRHVVRDGSMIETATDHHVDSE